MRQGRSLGSDSPVLPGLRTFIVPPDIAAVPRRSPVPVRKHTPCKPIVEGVATDRTGGRDWFGDHLAAQGARPRSSGVYTASAVVNIAAVAGLSALMLNRERPANPEPEQPLYVSVALALGSPIVPEIEVPKRAAPAEPARGESPVPKAEEPAVALEPAAPVDAPSSIEPEAAAEPPAGPVGAAIGTPEGSDRPGTPDGTGSGTAGGTGGAGQGPVRLGAGVDPPKKIKDVKAVYPPEALRHQLRGTVVIEATISAEGRVIDAVVRRSIPGLDQAALDAVRQWEYEPARMNGAPVAVIMTVTVAFSIL